MGVVVRQSILTTIISYVGVVIGYINLIFLYPKYLELEQIGLLRAIQDCAMLLTPFASVGLVPSISRFYPRFAKNQTSLSEFLGLLVSLALAGFIVVVILFTLFKTQIISFFIENAPEVTQYTGLILWLAFTLLYIGLFEQFARSQVKVAIPTFLREVGTRLLQSVLVLLYFSRIINFQSFLFLSVLIYVAMLSALVLYLKIYTSEAIQFKFNTLEKKQLKDIAIFSAVSFVGLSSAVLIAKLDSVMVVGLLGLSSNAIYTTSYYMASVIEIPKRAITQTSTALMSNAFEKGDIKEVNTIYEKASINQMIIGSLLLIGVWANVQNIFAIMPKGDQYSAGAWVILIVGSAKLLDMTFGPSSEVIGLSKYYWFNLVVISLLAILVIISNIILIPIYGMNGAALGTLLALTAYNVFKFGFILIKMKLNPFTFNTIKVLAILAITYFLNKTIPQLTNAYLDIIIRSTVITVVFSSLVLLSRCSEDVNKLFKDLISRILK